MVYFQKIEREVILQHILFQQEVIGKALRIQELCGRMNVQEF